jgi:hypothetical protein
LKLNDTKLSALTKKQTEKLSWEYIKYWQKQLRLLDWDIRLEVVQNPKDTEDSAAWVKKSQNYQQARITVLDSSKWPEDWTWGSNDLEVTIVHELLHVRLAYVTGKKQNCHIEMAVETLAMALVAARRGITLEELV